MNVSVCLCVYVSACMRACMHATVVRSQCACNIVPATFVSPLIKVSLSIFVQLLSIFVQCHGAPAITTVLVIIQPLSFLCTPSRRALRVAISPRCSPLPSGCSDSGGGDPAGGITGGAAALRVPLVVVASFAGQNLEGASCGMTNQPSSQRCVECSRSLGSSLSGSTMTYSRPTAFSRDVHRGPAAPDGS